MKEKNRLIFVLLATFLGFIGIHSYYTGNKLKALIQFIPGITGLIVLLLSFFLSIYVLLGLAFVLLVIPFVWAMYDIFTVSVDAYDVPLRDDYPRLGFWLPVVVDFIIPGLIILTLISVKLVPAIWVSHENTERLNCADNLNTLGMSLQMYALDHSGRYPNLENKKDFENLLKYDKRINYFVCQANTEQRYPFIWIGGYREPVSPKVPVAIERLGNHRGFINILFADGSVKSLEYNQPTYLQLAAALREEITKEEFELLKRKLRQLDNPQAAKPKPAPEANPAVKQTARKQAPPPVKKK